MLGQDKAKLEELVRNVESIAEHAKTFREQLPRWTFDLQALAQREQNVYQFVRDKIGFEPYRGFMKGARGALISRRANSADKALLLATLLQIKGQSPKLVRGTIDTIPAASPMPDLGGKPPDEEAIAAVAPKIQADAGKLRERIAKRQAEAEKFRDALWRRYERDLQTLSDRMGPIEIPATSEPSREHWWVRTRDGDLDPTLGEVRGKEVSVHELSSLPAEEFHRIGIRVKIRKDQEEILVLEVALQSPDAFGQCYRLTIVPSEGVPKEPNEKNLFEAIARARVFVPLFLSASKTVPGHPFDLQGNKLAVKDGHLPKLRAATGILEELPGGETKPKSELTGVWAEFTLHSPGARPLELRRNILHPGSKGRQRVLDLITPRDLLVLPGELSAAYLADVLLGHVASVQPRQDRAARRRPPMSPLLYAFAMERQAALRKIGGVAIMPRPTLVSHTRRFVDAQPVKLQSTIDILHNTLIGERKGSWKEMLSFAAGVLDTALEREAHRRPGEHINASALMEKSAPVLIREVPAGLSETARAELAKHLQGGVCLLVPSSPASWYRVDLETGATLGYVEGGGGQDMVEYVTLLEQVHKTLKEWNDYFELIRDILECVIRTLTAESDRGATASACAFRIISGQFIGTLVGAFFSPLPELPWMWVVEDLIADRIESWMWD